MEKLTSLLKTIGYPLLYVKGLLDGKRSAEKKIEKKNSKLINAVKYWRMRK